MGNIITSYGITNESGYIANVNANGQLAVDATFNVTLSGATVTAAVSGQTVISKISGETVRLISGHNDITVWAYDPSGLAYNSIWVNTSGGHSLQVFASGLAATADISGQPVRAVLTVSGTTPTAVGGFATNSGTGLMTTTTTKTFFMGYQTLPITQVSGGTQLLSGNSLSVTLKHIGISGVMYVGSSGIYPWCNDTQSGLGYPLNIGDSMTVEIDNPNKLYVAIGPANSSGQRLGYCISNY